MQGLLGMRRPPIILTKHNSKPTRTLGNAFRARWATDRVIAVSAHTGRLLEQGPYRRCPIDVVRNGVDLDRFAPLPADAGQAMRQQWTQDPDALLLVSNAGTDDYKGWIDLAQAIALLPDAIRPHVHMAVAGHLPNAQQRAQVQALGDVATQVHFTGLLADTRPLIAAGDVGFVLSNDIETISFACREMMASARPMLVSDYAGLPENIEQESTAGSCPPATWPPSPHRSRRCMNNARRCRRWAWPPAAMQSVSSACRPSPGRPWPAITPPWPAPEPHCPNA